MNKAEKSVLNKIVSGVYSAKEYVGRKSSMYRVWLAVIDQKGKAIPSHFYCELCSEVRIKTLADGTNQFLRHIKNFHNGNDGESDENSDDDSEDSDDEHPAGKSKQTGTKITLEQLNTALVEAAASNRDLPSTSKMFAAEVFKKFIGNKKCLLFTIFPREKKFRSCLV